MKENNLSVQETGLKIAAGMIQWWMNSFSAPVQVFQSSSTQIINVLDALSL